VVFTGFSPFTERVAKGQSANAIIADMTHRLGAVQEVFIIAVSPPVRGLGNQGGFKLKVQDRSGNGVRAPVAASYQLIGAARLCTPNI